MTYSDAANIYTKCIASASGFQDYQVCATEYQSNLVGAEYGLLSTPESLMTYSDAA